MTDEEKIYGLIVQAEDIQDSTVKMLDRAESAIKASSELATKPILNLSNKLDQAINNMNETTETIYDKFENTGMIFIFMMIISAFVIIFVSYESIKYLIHSKIATLQKVQEEIEENKKVLREMSSKTWNIKLMKNEEGTRWIVLPKGMKFNYVGKDKDGLTSIVLK